MVPTDQLGSGTADGTTFLRGDGSWSTPETSGGTWASITPGVETDVADTAGGANTGLAFTVESGKVYRISGLLTYSTALAGTAVRFAWRSDGSSAVAFIMGAFTSSVSDVGGQTCNVRSLDGWTQATQGSTTTRPVLVDVLLACTASGGLQLWFGTEVGGSSVQLVAGRLKLEEAA